eukprot:TRINITY_DN4714_c0_g1_i2.p1 TRINITY_DN4714_c0_g1~~TRINITY_DN4714_c0_g1_i2.p1  ORF type:complete len:126 (-),score=26.21 TRINITY_DN4714_c0_g1_i2:59-436(-)
MKRGGRRIVVVPPGMALTKQSLLPLNTPPRSTILFSIDLERVKFAPRNSKLNYNKSVSERDRSPSSQRESGRRGGGGGRSSRSQALYSDEEEDDIEPEDGFHPSLSLLRRNPNHHQKIFTSKGKK